MCCLWQSINGATLKLGGVKTHLMSFHSPVFCPEAYMWTHSSLELLGSPLAHAEYCPSSGVPSIQ